MNILHVSNWFQPAWESGGVARYVTNLTKSLSDLGHEIKVYTTDAYIDEPPSESPSYVNGVETYYFRNLCKKAVKKMNLTTPHGVLPIVIRQINDFDIVHIHEHRSPLSLIVAYAARVAGVPYLIQPHGSLPSDTGNRSLKKIWDSMFGKQMLQMSSGYVALHETEAKQFRDLGYNDNIHILRNGYSPHNEATGYNGSDFERDYDLTSEYPCILYVGRMSNRKGVSMLVDSIDMLDQDVQCILIGPDAGQAKKLKSQINSMSSDQVHYLGFVSENVKYEAYKYADIFTIPTRTGEGLPTTAFEALSFETPIVATKAANVEFIQKENCGIVVDIDANSFSNGISRLLAEDLDAMGKQGKDLVASEYNWDSISRECTRIYNKIDPK